MPRPREPAHHALGRSRGGFTTKLHLVCDGQGTLLWAHLTPGQRHDLTGFEPLLQSVGLRQPNGRVRRRPRQLSADKGFSCRWVRAWARKHHIRLIVPERKDQQQHRKAGRGPLFDPELYRRRNVVERAVGWLKERRRVATRYEKLAVNYLAMVHLAMIEQYLELASALPSGP